MVAKINPVVEASPAAVEASQVFLRLLKRPRRQLQLLFPQPNLLVDQVLLATKNKTASKI